MTTVLVSGWKVGFEKVKFTQLLQSTLGYSLSQAKGVTDAVLGGKPVELQVPAIESERLLLAMEQFGAECTAAISAR